MRFINNWITQLDAELPVGGTTLPIPAAALERLDLSESGYYLLPIVPSMDPLEQQSAEVVRIFMGQDGPEIERGVEQTTERAWPAGAFVFAGVTAGVLEYLANSAGADTGWIEATAQNDFPYPPSYRRLNGVVYLKGFIWIDSGYLNEAIAQLPEGFWPADNWQCIRQGTNATYRQYRVNVGSDGSIVIGRDAGTGNDYLIFDGIAFPVA
ncbi:hypothetical protein [Pseudomonas kuykendallii]|uniref:hypothetical protein n=1 Tax=Pseudomonas kuykendallii TaxID=1007099 RepID=UPI0028D5CD51|nr:hypothetical protein [Pseudomonas kuykendallii]